LVSTDYALMVAWFNTHGYNADIPELRKVHPALMNFERWVEAHKPVLAEEHVHA
jgi:hypothetical protein